MRIYRMIATFGKLEQETLVLEPGLNVITAPNEWGKSTWCAFLVAMLYGLDTRAKTTKNNLADKERYAPWSGSPMAGRIDLNWQGRDITIERTTRRRIPLGDFRAYETETGLLVEELTAANCGQQLLNVEQEVFRRAGFIRHSDLPVTQDEALRRRLNALVTTGDDSGAADHLAASLKDLKNRCRYNRSGLLPQAEAQREELESKLRELTDLEQQIAQIDARMEELGQWSRALYNHQQAHAYAKMEADMQRVNAAGENLARIQEQQQAAEEACAGLPDRITAAARLEELRIFQEACTDLQRRMQLLPPKPEPPVMDAPFAGMKVDAAYHMAKRDAMLYEDTTRGRLPIVMLLLGLFGLGSGGVLLYMEAVAFAAAAGVTGLIALVWSLLENRFNRRQSRLLREKYGNGDYRNWSQPVQRYEAALRRYRVVMQDYTGAASQMEEERMALHSRGEELCAGQSVESQMEQWQRTVSRWEYLEALRREAQNAQSHWESLRDMVHGVDKPAMEDTLTYSMEETQQLLAECDGEQQRLHNRAGQYQGRMALLGDRGTLTRDLEQTVQRIAQLEETYGALLIAQETLAEARAELQRRFAPRITRRAQEYLRRMTGGRYHSLTMGQDFTLRAGADREETLRDALWRSDGTIDQLYLALRLAVAEELTPEAPLILDDALVRFDDRRMAQTMALLKDMAKTKQVICFTCQGREETV